MYYIYVWYIKESNEIFYVGKGSKKRYLSKQHNSLFKKTIEQYSCESKIVEYFEDEQEAYKREFDLINELKLKGQCKCNIVKGGNGGGASSNTKMSRWTEEERKKYSINNSMKDERQRKRMSQYNPMSNKDIAKKVGLKHRKPFFVGNKKFNCLEEAVIHYNLTKSSINHWLKVGHNANELCYYEGESPKEHNFTKNYHISRAIEVEYDGKIYSSIKDLAKNLGICYTSLHKKIRKNQKINGKEVILRQSEAKPNES